MENISHSRQLPSSLSKKTYNGGGSLNFPPSKAIYDDVFGGPPRFGAPSLSPQAEDYAEIFGGFHASRASSIPVLDLPLVDDDGEVFFDVRSSGFDYDEVFGGFNDSDFAVSYDELVKLGQSNAHGDSSDEAWTPDEAEYLSEESDRAKNQCLLNGDRYEDDSMEFNISYHKACQGSNDDLTNGSSHITQFHAVPGRTFVVDRGTSLPKIDNEYPPLEVSDDDAHFNIDFSGEMLMERSLRKTMSQPANGVSGRPLFENDVEAHREYVRHGSFPNKMFVTISDVSLRTQPSQVPPPSRPPPALDVGNRDSTKLLSNCKGVATGDSSPPYFDVEVDASSSAAVSAAAMKEAMEKAQAKLKSAKELMERKREGFHSRTKSGSKSDKKDKERDFAGAVDDTGITRDERVQGTHEREENGLGIYDVDRQNVMMTTPQIPNSLEGKKLLNLTKNPVEEKHERQCLSSQGSDTVDGASEWKEATQFFELVRPSKSRKTFDQAISDSSFTQNTNIIEHGKKEKKAATESMEQHLENDEKGNGARADNELEEYEKKSAVLEEAWQCEENDGRSGATKIAYRQKVTEKKVQKAQEVSRWKENEKKLRMDRQPLETEKKKTRAHVSQKDENMLDLRFQAKETMKLKEKEPPTEEANRSMEDEKRVVREKEDGERRRREVSKREEKEKNLKAALDQVENEKRLKEALEREEEEKRIKEVQEQEENEKKQKEAYEKQENEKRLREALEQEEKEKRLKEAIEKEESERRLKEAIEKEESERRLKEFLEKEERESRLKEALKKEQRERRKKEAIEREENEKRRKEACEREEKEKKLKEAYEREESGKRLNEALEKEENERRLREVLKREEYEKGERESHEREEYEKKLKEALEHEENKEEEKDANEREDTEKRQREAFGRGKNEKRIKEICENKDIGKQIDVELEEEVDDEYLREAQDGKESKGQKEIHDQKQVGDTSQENCNWEDTRIRFKDGGEGEELIGQAKIGKVHSISNETYNLVDKTNLGETQLAGKDEGMTEKMDATGKVVNKETRKVQIGLRCNENDAAGGKEDVWVDGKKEVSGMEDAVRLSHADEQKAGEAGHCIGQRNVEKFKSGTGMSSDVENQGKNFTRERSEKGNNIKLAQVSQNQEDKRDNLSARIVKESVDARRTGATQPVTTEVKGTIQQTSQDVNANQSADRKVKNFSHITAEGFKREKDLEKEHLRKIEEEREREREREKDRMAVDIATLEARERAYSEVRVRAERAAVERAAAEARERAMNEARERLEKTCAEVRERSLGDKTAIEARLRAERAAVERATAEARERAFEKAMAERAVFEARERVVSDKFSASSRTTGMRPSSSSLDSQDSQPLSTGSFGSSRYPYPAVCSGPYNMERSSGVDGESPQRCKARLERHRRTAERAAKALAEKNMRDLLAQKEQAERHRIAETLDAEIRRWSSGKEGNLRALLSTLQYILGPDSGWQPIPLTEVITSAAVKKAYRKATLCVHPDKLQQRGASIQQKYICEKVFDLLKEAWNRFNSEER